jgi:uncharacterized protein YbcC (UPF0753/DUF2309 family)
MKDHSTTSEEPAIESLARAADAAGRQVPPLWPLASHVAVNPYLGQTEHRLAKTAAILSRVGGGPLTMPRSWYKERAAKGQIIDVDLAAAIAASPHAGKPTNTDALKAAMEETREPLSPLPTIADLAAATSGTDWPDVIADRIGVWAGGYFDAGQALWAVPARKGAWDSFRFYATHDITPEIMGLKGFGARAAESPSTAIGAIAHAADRLGLDPATLEAYGHRLLQSMGGWAQYARYHLWRAELADDADDTLTDLLAIRLLWEEALHDLFEDEIAEDWATARAAYGQPVQAADADIVDEILQEAAERGAQRMLAEKLATPLDEPRADRPKLQAAFCIDVRSEVFRRALESVDPRIQSLGFAGFFGVFTRHRGFASDVDELRLPVLLNPTVDSRATSPENAGKDLQSRFQARAKRAWGRFKLAAVSSFAFVEAMGPVYIVKLLRDALGLNPAAGPNDPTPRFDAALDAPARIDAAETVLRAMSLTGDFARLVLLAGHGANVVNNPQASGLHCGACGGYSGEVNARLLAGLFNDPDVRSGLIDRGIEIPSDTLFVGGLHDTTTDAVTLYDVDVDASAHASDLKQAREWLSRAGIVTRTERAARLPRAADGGDIARRARDWAEVRPEWGLAGCGAFIAAPRAHTSKLDLSGRSFLHDYDWKQDSANGFPVLELIMTAPVVVASWISLQYYGSTVAPDVFGAGNKLLHNVVGGVGVFEGNGGVMRGGLSWQSVHDGENYAHDPLRLTVCIAAPREAMTDILGRHDGVRALFDNRWLHLFALDDGGRMAWRYTGDLTWEQVDGGVAADQETQAVA